MKVGALLTSAGINIGLCILLLSFYSILRKQPQNVKVYFGRRIAEQHKRLRGAFILERFVPSPSWIVRSLQCTEDEILSTAGLDAVVFNRVLVFSIRIFSLAAVLCLFGVLPLNYFGQDMLHEQLPSASLETFTIGNMQEKSRWLWVHCVVLYIISGVACFLLYMEYKHIARLRLLHLVRTKTKASHFTVLVRGIPKSTHESFNSAVESFFTTYHAPSYLSHQVVYKVGKLQKIVTLRPPMTLPCTTTMLTIRPFAAEQQDDGAQEIQDPAYPADAVYDYYPDAGPDQQDGAYYDVDFSDAQD